MIFKFSPFPVQKIGRHWDKDVEMDVVALNETEKKILFGECKWTNQKMDVRILNELKRNAATVDWHLGKRKEYFILFSKSGFAADVIALAKKDQHIILIDWQNLSSLRLKNRK